MPGKDTAESARVKWLSSVLSYPTPLAELTVTTLGEFIGYIEKNCIADEIIFRGQAQADWPLVPKTRR